MTIGIIVAMSKELNLLLPLLNEPSCNSIDGFTFHIGKIGDKKIVAMQCGIGKVNAAIGAVTMIKNFNIDLIINSGVAGGADSTVNVMDIVIGTKVAYHDVYCGPESTLGAVQGLPLFYEPGENTAKCITPQPHTHLGLICSGDQFIDTAEQIEKIKAAFPQVKAVDMESAAIAQTCYLFNTDFISIRVISDSPGAGHDNTLQYSDFWAEAPEHTFAVVTKLIQSI